MALIISGCAEFRITRIYLCGYGPGSVLYVLAQARKGIMEKIVVKHSNLTGFIGKSPVFNYIDTMNRVWLYNELTTQANALNTAIAHIEGLLENSSCIRK